MTSTINEITTLVSAMDENFQKELLIIINSYIKMKTEIALPDEIEAHNRAQGEYAHGEFVTMKREDWDN